MNKGKICISVCAGTVDELIAQIKRAEELADIIEVRFDCLDPKEFDYHDSTFKDAQEKHGRIKDVAGYESILTTFRIKEQGGLREIDQDERSNFWAAGIETEYVDLEEDQIDDSFAWLWNTRICSFHDFSGVSADLESIFDRLAKNDAEVIKMAIAANDITDAIPVWKLFDYARRYKQVSRPKVIPIAMGEAGKWTRILGLAHGSFLTYAALDAGRETADGQITAKDLIETYRVKELDENTQVFGVIGNPVSQSLSPYMHNPSFAAVGVNAVFMHLLVKDIDEFMRRMVKVETREVELNFGGFSVTMPHKQSIMKYLDAIDLTAEKIGAVNTVKIDDGKLTGYNTDAYGFITPLKVRLGSLRDARVAIFGAGGASRACVYALKEEGADVTVFARDIAKAEAFANKFDIKYEQLTTDHRQLTTDIIVDATPIGMKGPFENETLFIADELAGVKFVYDLVTRSTDTPLIREANKAGIPALGGIEMLLAQGAKQFEIWTGLEASVEMMRDSIVSRMQK